MAGSIKGITIELNGDARKLTDALKEVNSKSNDLYRQLREVDTALKFNPGNSDLIAQKQRILSETVENTKNKINQLKDAHKQASGQLERGEIGQDQFDALTREIIKAEDQLKSYQGELSKTGDIALKEVAGKFEQAGQKLTSAGKTLSTYVTAPIVAVGTAGFMMAADLEDAFGATEQIFKGAGGDVKMWAEELQSYYGISEKDALEYANVMGAMLQNIGGLSEAEAAKMASKLVELSGDLSAMFGGNTESAVQALTGALKGNNTMLDNYGMGVNDATIKTKALEEGLWDGEGQMSLAAKQGATLALIMEQTADAQGQAARESESASGSMKSFKAEITNLSTEIGEILLPVITPMIEALKDFVERLKDMSPETLEMIVKIAAFAAVFGPVLIVLGALAGAISKIIGFFTLLKPVMAVVGGALAGISAPVAIVIAAFTALTAGILWLNSNWDLVVEKVKEVGEYLANKWAEIKEYLSQVMTQIGDFVSEKWQALKDRVSSIVESIRLSISEKWNAIKTGVSDAVESIKKKVGDIWEGIKTATKNAWDEVKRFITEPIEKARDAVKGAIDKVKSILSGELSFPKIKLPHFSITGKFSLNPPQIPKLGVQWYDQGGIFKSPTVIGVGEKRPEFVGALDDLRSLIGSELDKRSGGIIIEQMIVRNDHDIYEIARELDKLRRRMA